MDGPDAHDPDGTAHPLAELFDALGRGRFPPTDGAVRVVAPPSGRPGVAGAVVAFTAHNIVAAAVPAAEVLARLPSDDFGAPTGAPFLAWLARRLDATPGGLDAVLVALPVLREEEGGAQLTLVPHSDPAEHPRVQRARRLRREVAVYADLEGRGLVTLGRGLAGRWELSVEVAPAHRGAGLGRRLIAAGRRLAPAGAPLFAQVAPGNAASLRAFLAAGFRPAGAEALLLRVAAR